MDGGQYQGLGGGVARHKLISAIRRDEAPVWNPSVEFYRIERAGTLVGQFYLDPQARQNLWQLIRGIRKGGTTVMLTTHYMDEAEQLCERVAVMDSGHIIAMNTPDHLIDELVASGFERKKEVKKANLEDVFLHLTGREWKDE